ncbi:hypothetical protein BG005_002156, partial [Podila minutissima]
MALNSPAQTELRQGPDLKLDISARPIEINRHWVTLGPFPTGMREQDFGADPLEAY